MNVKDAQGHSIFQGRRATSFSNEEEEQVKLTNAIPFLVESRLKELGAKYEKNSQAWGPHVTVDGQRQYSFLHQPIVLFIVHSLSVILGANPASAHDFGVAIRNALQSK